MEIFNIENEENEMCNVILHLNMRLMPTDRERLFDNPLDEMLHKNNIGKVIDSGTMFSDEEMPIFCEIEFAIKKSELDKFIEFLKHVNTMAKDGYVEYDGKKEAIGTLEGLNLILDDTGLDEDVYKENDVNIMIDEIMDLMEGKGEYHSYYIGEKNTNLYFYGPSFVEMKEVIANYAKTSPLCENCKIEQI